MKRSGLKKTFSIVGVILIIWLVLAQSCMKFRISDTDAIENFSKAGIELKTETIKVDGFNMHFAKTGNDTLPTLFFVHGSPGSWNAFEKYMQDKDLLSKYRMISVDRPGFGYSNFNKAKNLDEQSELIAAVVKKIQNNKSIYAIGHSLGGPMIIKLQVDNPGMFNGLILLAASVDPNEEKPEKWRGILKNTPLKYFVPGAFRPSNDEIWYLKKDLKKLDKEWDAIICPVWILHGDKDTFVPVGNAAYAKNKLKANQHVEIKILNGARHFIPWEQYNDIKDVLMKLTN
jgi:pimeloyl-ACP methyl ester carboxylesterase